MGLLKKVQAKKAVKKKSAKKKTTAKKQSLSKKISEIRKKAKAQTKQRLAKPKIKATVQKEIKKQRKPLAKIKKEIPKQEKIYTEDWVQTGLEGLDSLLEKGIPRGTSVIIAGGPGSGKTILCLQMLNNAVKNGEKAIYISLEEHPARLEKHMHDFGWHPEKYIKKGILKIRRIDPFTISRNVEAMLAEAKGELTISVEELGDLIPENFKPKWVILDSLTALESAFKDEEDTYRIYIQQLFRYFERIGVNSFLITETENIPKQYSRTGVEEFLADGVIVLYHLKKGNIRERAIEILKLRGSGHQSKIVAMQILSEVGMEVYPEQEIFGGVE